MTKRSAKPGAPPSPNQSIVLQAIKDMYALRGEVNMTDVGMTIVHVHGWLKHRHLGGNWKEGSGWKPWSESTVRDHLNDLAGKGHVKKQIVHPAAYYRPADD